MPSVEIIDIKNPSFDFQIHNLQINFKGVKVSDSDTRYNTSKQDILYVLNKNTKSVYFQDLQLKDIVLRNRNLTSKDKNLTTTNTKIAQVGDFISIKNTFLFKGKAIGELEIQYPYSYYIKENTLLLPFQSFPVKAQYKVLNTDKILLQYFGQSITEPNKKTGIMDVNYIVQCLTKEGVEVSEDFTISVNLMNGGFVRTTGGTVIDPEDDGYDDGSETRTTAWRAASTSQTCQVNTISPAPLYGKLTTTSTSYDNYVPDHQNPSDRTYGTRGNLVLTFYNNPGFTGSPVNLLNQTIKVNVQHDRFVTDYEYDINDAQIQNSYNERTITTKVYQGVSGSQLVLETDQPLETTHEVNPNYDPQGMQSPDQLRLDSYSSDTYSLFETTQITGGQTGLKQWNQLEQYYVDDNTATGVVKANVDTDPDYIAPVTDASACPVDVPVTTVFFGSLLTVYTVQLTANGVTQTVGIPSGTDTQNGGWSYQVRKTPGAATTLVAKVDSQINHTIKVYINYGNNQNATVLLTDNTQMSLGTFTNIKTIQFSNF